MNFGRLLLISAVGLDEFILRQSSACAWRDRFGAKVTALTQRGVDTRPALSAGWHR
jgi:hypothetical protein